MRDVQGKPAEAKRTKLRDNIVKNEVHCLAILKNFTEECRGESSRRKSMTLNNPGPYPLQQVPGLGGSHVLLFLSIGFL